MVRLKVKEVAESQGYNMSSLSRASDVSFRTIKRIFRDPLAPVNTDTLGKIATALKVDVSELLENVADKDIKKDARE